MWELANRTDQIDHVMIEAPGTELPTSFLKRLKLDLRARAREREHRGRSQRKGFNLN